MSRFVVLTFSFIHTLVGMFFLFYLALGASVFKAIEGPLEKEEINSLLEQKKRFLTKHICLSGRVHQFVTLSLH